MREGIRRPPRTSRAAIPESYIPSAYGIEPQETHSKANLDLYMLKTLDKVLKLKIHFFRDLTNSNRP